ncbi:MAG: hypothetical protein ACFFBH_12660 [Promethearchaeota archaeon]
MHSKCVFTDLCSFCDDFFYNLCCLRSIKDQKDFKKCIKIGLCPNLNLCQDAINGKLRRTMIFHKVIPNLKDIESFDYIVKYPFSGFKTRFIPRISVYGESSKRQIEIVKNLNLNCIIVSLKEMISNRDGEILKEDFKVNLHEKFNYDGQIILQTNIPDCFCMKIINNSDEYILALKCLRPDIITTFDANFYLDQPLFVSSIQMLNILKANRFISEIDIPQIFLLPPAPIPLFKSIFDVFIKSNHQSICIPCGEFKKSDQSYLLKIIRYINHTRKIMDKNFELLLISKNPDKSLFSDCYSSNSWTKIKKGNNGQNHSDKMQSNLDRTIKKANKIRLQKSLISFIRRGV